MEEFENKDDKISETIESAKNFFLRMHDLSEEKDIEKTAMCFYDIIKHTYGLAKEQGVYDKDKEEMDITLKGMMVMLGMMQMQHGWTTEMMTEFDDKVMKLWNID